MLIRIGDSTLLEDLRANFVRAGFAARTAGEGMLEVERPDSPSREQERREVEIHLRVWRATHAGATVEIIG